ncbi:MAG: hypothetical protein QOJ75_1102, partial [Chloroflexota bacterium]|nr:hypothetical protein [Chloroflexota bacterium]
FTSGNTATFVTGSSNSFSVTTSGNPAPTISRTGTLPSGVTFIDNGNGTGTLSGTPAAGTTGTYTLTFTAANGNLPNATQTFTLTVKTTPVITSANNATFTIGAAGSFTVTTTGTPTPTVGRTGTLPSGVSFVGNADGTGTLSGTPASGTAGTYPLTFTATNGAPPNASQSFTLTVVNQQVVPGQPAPPTASAGPGKGITVHWTAPSNLGSPITSYTLQRFLNCAGSPTTISPGNVLSYKDNSTTRGSGYCYTVAATNGSGTGQISAPSPTVIAAK